MGSDTFLVEMHAGGRKEVYLDVVGMAGAVRVGVMSVGCGVFYMRGIDGNSSGLLLGGVVNLFILFEAGTTCISKD